MATIPTVQNQPLYLGCIDRAGHYLWSTKGEMLLATSEEFARRTLPWERIDGALTPKSSARQSGAMLHQAEGWTALSMHDYSIDRRPGSNATFLLPGTLTFAEALDAARAAFPHVVERIEAAAPIVELEA